MDIRSFSLARDRSVNFNRVHVGGAFAVLRCDSLASALIDGGTTAVPLVAGVMYGGVNHFELVHEHAIGVLQIVVLPGVNQTIPPPEMLGKFFYGVPDEDYTTQTREGGITRINLGGDGTEGPVHPGPDFLTILHGFDLSFTGQPASSSAIATVEQRELDGTPLNTPFRTVVGMGPGPYHYRFPVPYLSQPGASFKVESGAGNTTTCIGFLTVFGAGYIYAPRG